MKYRYFMSYAYRGGAGNLIVERDDPIIEIFDIRVIEEQLNEQHVKDGKHVITFWRRFEDPI